MSRTQQRFLRVVWSGMLCVVLPPVLVVSTVTAQSIMTDGSVGLAGTLLGPNYIIPDSLGQTRGTNLFHSFSKFSVLTGESANFTGPNSIRNIFSRVTGGGLSTINGSITSGIPGVNVFLLNPAGVLFGPSASVNIGGSFRVSTADYVRFADGYQFAAKLGADGNFTSAPYAAFGFLTPTPAPITFSQSAIEVKPGATLAVVGGDITLTGPTASGGNMLQAQSGEVHVISVASSGEVPLVATPAVLALSVEGFSSLGVVTLTGGAKVGAPPTVGNGTPGGRIVMRGGRLVMDQGSAIFASTGGDVSAPPVALDIDMRGAVVMDNGSVITATNTGGLGNGGKILLSAADLELRNGSAINNFYASQGNGSDLIVNTGRFLMTDGAGIIGKNTGARNIGNGGVIEITATESMLIGPGSIIQTENFQGIGTGSPIHITTPYLTIEGASGLSGKAGITGITGGFGPASSVTLNVGTLELKGQQALIDTRARNVSVIGGGLPTEGGGAVTVQGQGGKGTVADLVTITGKDSGFLTETEGLGAGGPLTIAARQLVVQSDGRISANTTAAGSAGAVTLNLGALEVNSGGRLESSSSGKGQGGTIVVQGAGGTGTTASSLTITGGGSGLFSTTSSTGAGGSITVNAGQVTITDGGTISGASTGTAAGSGNAGNLTVNAGTQLTMDNGSVTTEAKQASGGDITIQATDMVQLSNSKITTSVNGPAGSNGGNISIDPEFVILMNGSQILAQAVGGNGGNITIVANTFLAEPGTLIDASSQLGVSGTVNIQAPVNSLSSSIAPLSEKAIDAVALIRASCAARYQSGERSSLVQRGRDTLPADPGTGLVPSPLLVGRGIVADILAELGRDPALLLAARNETNDVVDQRFIKMESAVILAASAYCKS